MVAATTILYYISLVVLVLQQATVMGWVLTGARRGTSHYHLPLGILFHPSSHDGISRCYMTTSRDVYSNEEDQQQQKATERVTSIDSSNGSTTGSREDRLRRRQQRRRRNRSKNHIMDPLLFQEEKQQQSSASFGERIDPSTQQRRNKRQQRKQPDRNPTSWKQVASSTARITSDLLPDPVVDMGGRATRIAKQKSKKVWNKVSTEWSLIDDAEETHRATRRSRRQTSQPPPAAASSSSGWYDSQNTPETRQRRRRANPSQPFTEPDDDNDNEPVRFVEAEPVDSIPQLRSKQKKDIGSSSPSPTGATTKQQQQQRPIQDILAELDSLEIPYGATASRDALENAIKQARETSASVKTTSIHSSIPQSEQRTTTIPTTDHTPETDRTKRRTTRLNDKRRETVNKRQSSPSASRSTKGRRRKIPVDRLRKRVKAAVDRVTRVFARPNKEYMSSSSYDDTNDDGVVDVVVEAFVENPTEPTTTNANKNINNNRQKRPTRRRNSKPSAHRRRRAPRPSPHSAVSSQTTARQETTKDLPRLPPRDHDEMRRRRSTSTGRHIYSPYTPDQQQQPFLDDLEELGDTFGRTVDAVLWGVEEEDSTRRPAKKPSAQNTSSSSRRRKPSKSANWKDRMEEGLDNMMGIHEDGKFYQRWANQAQEDEEDAEGADILSYATGRTKVPRKRRAVKYEKAIWEYPGGVLSNLFATLQEEDNTDPSLKSNGSLVKLTSTVLRTLSVFAGRMIRWASVNRSIPPPAISMGAIATLLSSPPGTRIRNVVFLLLVARVFAELVHGSFLEDDDDEEYADVSSAESLS